MSVFSRSSDKGAAGAASPGGASVRMMPQQQQVAQETVAVARPPMAAGGTQPPNVQKAGQSQGGLTKSVIGRDLAIIGSGLKIVSQGLLQVDGEVQGDVVGLKVVIGPSGKVTGLVNAEEILVQGTVYGEIRAIEVMLAASSTVEGDLFHQSLGLEQGAVFEGRSRRVANREDLLPDLSDKTPSAAA